MERGPSEREGPRTRRVTARAAGVAGARLFPARSGASLVSRKASWSVVCLRRCTVGGGRDKNRIQPTPINDSINHENAHTQILIETSIHVNISQTRPVQSDDGEDDRLRSDQTTSICARAFFWFSPGIVAKVEFGHEELSVSSDYPVIWKRLVKNCA
jgi:hypothetical protein